MPSAYVNAQQKTGLNYPGLAFIYSVQPDSPVDQKFDLGRTVRQDAGKFDTYVSVLSVNGQDFTTQQDLVNQLSTITKGQQVRMHLFETELDPRYV